jgi:serine kinase of HPr protein (carbohydrate metabolism regulator)
MKLTGIMAKLNLECLNKKPINDEVIIKNGYISDLLSQVIAGVKPNSLWMTLQSHLNIIAVAVMANIPAIVICENHNIPDEVIMKADEEQIAIFKSKETSFQLAGKLYECGIR